MILDFLLGLLWTLLPQGIRRRRLAAWQVNLRTSAVMSGIVQALGLLAVLIFRYFHFMNYRLGMIAGEVVKRDAATVVGDVNVQFGMGFVSFVEFLIQPLTLLIIYFIFEGLVRTTASVVSGEVVGTLPLLLVDKAVEAIRDRKEEKRQGEIIPDLVTPVPMEGCGYELSVSSCRAKPNWNELMTVSYNETLYEVSDYLEAAPPRRHVYLLRRAPQNKVVRGLHHYDPEEVLRS